MDTKITNCFDPNDVGSVVPFCDEIPVRRDHGAIKITGLTETHAQVGRRRNSPRIETRSKHWNDLRI